MHAKKLAGLLIVLKTKILKNIVKELKGAASPLGSDRDCDILIPSANFLGR